MLFGEVLSFIFVLEGKEKLKKLIEILNPNS